MGFGILFFGYFVMFAFSFSSTYFFADIIGAFISMFAFAKLSEYNGYFKNATAATLVFMIFSAVNAASMMFRLYETGGEIYSIVTVLKNCAACVIHVLMFLGARGISMNAESVKLQKNAERNLVVTMLYYAAYFVIAAIGFFAGESAMLGYASMFVSVYWLVCIVQNMILLYKCFGILAPADEDEGEIKQSRFGFINKINAKMDEFEENRTSYARESMLMAQEEAKKLEREKRRNKKKTKKRK